MNRVVPSTALQASGSCRDLAAAAGRLLDLGFGALALHAELREDDWALLAGRFRPGTFVAAYAFTPLRSTLEPGAPRPPRLGSLDPDERREAVKQACRTVEFLDRFSIALMLVPSARLDEPAPHEVDRALSAPRRSAAAAWQRLIEKRTGSGVVLKQLDSYLGCLDAILERASRYDRRVAIVAGVFPCDLPLPAELRRLQDAFAGAPLEIYHDLLRLERRLRAAPADAEAARIEETLTSFSGAIVRAGPGGERGEGGEIDLKSLVDRQRWRRALKDHPPRGERLWILELPSASDAGILEASDALQGLWSEEVPEAPRAGGILGPLM
jgi:hypothetical protein